MEQKLKDYSEGKIHYTPIMNIILNNRSKNWYDELGKYITETLDIGKIPELDFISDRLNKRKSVLTKIKDFLTEDSRLYFSVASFFLTSALNKKSLENMFGKPILHDEFGEGFEGDWDEETDEYGEPEIKESHASYFVNVDGTNFHIGYDHRGTGIEIEIPSKFNYDGVFSDEDAKKCFESLKKLVDLYKLKN
jgi:hypothetical protein